MGVFNKTPYTNFHELNLNWVIKKIKEVTADNAYFKQFFKTIEDEHILGVVTKVTENNDNTVKTDYLNESTQQMDNYTVYNKTGTDGAISGAVTPIANRVTTAEGDIDSLETLVNQKVAKNVSIASGSSIREFITNTNNRSGVYIVNIQNASDNPAGTGVIATALIYKHTDNGSYSEILIFYQKHVLISDSIGATVPATLTFHRYRLTNITTATVTTSANGYVDLYAAMNISKLNNIILAIDVISSNAYALLTGSSTFGHSNWIRILDGNGSPITNTSIEIRVTSMEI